MSVVPRLSVWLHAYRYGHWQIRWGRIITCTGCERTWGE